MTLRVTLTDTERACRGWRSRVYEAAATPLAYATVTLLKRHKRIDTYDIQASVYPLMVAE